MRDQTPGRSHTTTPFGFATGPSLLDAHEHDIAAVGIAANRRAVPSTPTVPLCRPHPVPTYYDQSSGQKPLKRWSHTGNFRPRGCVAKDVAPDRSRAGKRAKGGTHDVSEERPHEQNVHCRSSPLPRGRDGSNGWRSTPITACR